MSLRLLVDEDTQGRDLVVLLRQAGHDVLTVNEAGLRTQADPILFAFAQREQRCVLTQNARHFRLLHEADPEHQGILAIFHDDDRRKDMTPPAIVRAIANLEASGWSLDGQFVTLNAWNYEPLTPPDA